MTATALPRPAGVAFAVRTVASESAKGLQLMWRRRATLVMSTVTLALIYLMIEFFVGGGRIDHTVLRATLPALFAYAVASTAASQGAGGIAEELNGGTMEQSQLTPARAELLVLGRLGALTVEGLVPAVVLTALLWGGFGLHYPARPDTLVPLLLTIVDAMAYGLLMVALTLAVSSIGALMEVFNMVVMFFGGMFVPGTALPHGVETFARFVPTTLGVVVMNTTLTGHNLSAAWADGTLPWLLAHVAVLSGLAWAAYSVTVRRARAAGGLSPR
jgi:ABC-2 type transport system permease protein